MASSPDYGGDRSRPEGLDHEGNKWHPCSTALYRLPEEEDTAVEGNLDGFRDADRSRLGLRTRCAGPSPRGVISGGTSGGFRPAGTATRAEVASVLMRYLRK